MKCCIQNICTADYDAMAGIDDVYRSCCRSGIMTPVNIGDAMFIGDMKDPE